MFKQDGKKKTIIVAMSGGVDSSTVAAMLHQEGHNIIGMTMQLYDHGAAIAKKGACCAGQDIYDAKMVAAKLGIPHYILDYESHFRDTVINDFADSYIRGETPLPCVRCNQSVKFKDLLSAAKQLGADALATGHYVRKVTNGSKVEMHKAVDISKDQSYFLFATTQEQLEYLMFPLGEYSKDETRILATQYGLEIADKPDSQDICFVPNGNYRDVINKIKPGASLPGRFMHVDGYDLGEHKGIINYTIGQRRGMGISHANPIYVTKIDPEKNIVYLGPESALYKTRFLIKDINWLGSEFIDNGDYLEGLSAKIRSTNIGVQAKVRFTSRSEMEVILLEQEKSITPGQACVLYDGPKLMGGGWITREIQ